MTRPMVTGPTLTQMALNTSDSGKTTNSMVSDLSPGPMVQFTRVTIVKVRNMAKDGSRSLMALCTRVSFT